MGRKGYSKVYENMENYLEDSLTQSARNNGDAGVYKKRKLRSTNYNTQNVKNVEYSLENIQIKNEAEEAQKKNERKSRKRSSKRNSKRKLEEMKEEKTMMEIKMKKYKNLEKKMGKSKKARKPQKKMGFLEKHPAETNLIWKIRTCKTSTDASKIAKMLNNKYEKRREMRDEVNKRGLRDTTACMELAKNQACNPTMFRLLLDRYTLELDSADYRGYTALHWATVCADTQKMYALLKKGAGVDVYDQVGSTALHVACRYGYKDAIDLLLQNGARINKKNGFGYTPLHFACESSMEGLVYYMLQKGASPYSMNRFGKTPLMRAIQWGNKADIALLFNHKFHNYNHFGLLWSAPDDEIKAFVLDLLRISMAGRIRDMLKKDFGNIVSNKEVGMILALGLKKPSKKQTYVDAPKKFLSYFNDKQSKAIHYGKQEILFREFDNDDWEEVD